MKIQKPRFHYHAHAIALSGEVTHPFHEVIDVQAPATIPPTGGFSSSHTERYRLPGILMHHGARSKATGKHSPEAKTHEAMAHVGIEGLNIEDVLTVDFVTAHLSATYYTELGDDQEPQITPRGSMFHKLRIAGRDIILEPNVDLYHELDTMAKVKKAYSNNTNGFKDTLDRDAFIGQESVLPESHFRFFPWRKHEPSGDLPEKLGHTVVPLFIVKNENDPGVFEVRGNVVYVRNFGRIHLGEMVITPCERRVTMIYADLGSPADADLAVNSGCVGGGPID